MRKNKRRNYRESISQPLEARRLLSTYYVDANAPGTTQDGAGWDTAFKDLQGALVNKAVSGDTILVADGTYKPTSNTDRTKSFILISGVRIYGGYAGYGASDPDARDATLYTTILSGDIGYATTDSDNSYHVVTATGVSSSTVLDGLTITRGNAAIGTGINRGYGGGMLNLSSSSPTLNNCTFKYNTADQGCGMYNSFSSPTLTNCVFTENVGPLYYGGSDYGGGGIFNYNASPILTNCVFSKNMVCNGGGVLNDNSSPTLTNCTFSANYASFPFTGYYGGGLYNRYSSSPTLINCTFTTNSASYGGGIYNYSSSPTLTNCTLAGNTSSYSPGGGMYNYFSSPVLINSIIWSNGPTPIYNSSSSSVPIVAYCDIEGGYSGTGNINAEPYFVRSPWAGPGGYWNSNDDITYDLRLQAGSPCLDAGLNSANSTYTDLSGNNRIQNGTIDMGAYEGASANTAKMLYVDLNAAGDNSGTSWINAFTSLQSAILAATDGDTIKVADGTYYPTNTANREISFAMKNAVSIYGGYAGYGASNPDTRDISLYPTLLSGDIGTHGTNTDNSFHVVTGLTVGSSTIINGLTITLGYAQGSSLNQYSGGGMLLVSSSPTLTHCTFALNSAYSLTYSNGNGGGLFNSSSSPTLTNCVFINNSTSFGGGISNYFSSPTITNCTFSGNSASYRGGGGGIYNTSSSPILINCMFSGNVANIADGGGLYNNSSTPTLTNCTFSGNSAISGDGMYNKSSSPILTNCILWNNGPTPIINSSSTPIITYCDIEGGYTGTGNINSDPLFEDYLDLRLQPGSPCINKGLNSANTQTTDLDGNPRIIDSTIDMGAYESPIPSFAGNNLAYQISLSNGQILLSDAAGQPLSSYSASTLTLSNIQSLLIQNASADNISLSPSQLTLGSSAINYSNSPTFTLLNSALNTLALTGNVSLKIPSNLVIATGNAQTIRSYLFNASIGAKPSLISDSSTTLALLDNSKLHKTSFAGQTLLAPFSQLLIQGAAAGDANLDGVVNNKDLLAVYANMGKTNATWLDGDLNQDGSVNLGDVALAQSKMTPAFSRVLKTVSKAPAGKKSSVRKPKIHRHG